MITIVLYIMIQDASVCKLDRRTHPESHYQTQESSHVSWADGHILNLTTRHRRVLMQVRQTDTS